MPEDLHDDNFLLKTLMDHMPDSIYFKDRQSRFIMGNKTCAKKHGWGSPQDMVGATDFDAFTKEHADQAYADEIKIVQTGEPLAGIEEKETWPDGSVTWASTTKMPLKNTEGEIIGTFGVSRDITAHKEAELRAAYYAEEVRRIKEEMEEEVRMAGELQKTFFPRSYPVFPEGVPSGESAVQFFHQYHASGEVSGDFCSISRLSETESGILLCDVMGHGVRAALGTALICAMIEDPSQQRRDPAAFLARINELLLPILRQEDMFLYATACYMVLDAATGRLRFANAGHPVPMHFRASKNSVDWLMDDESLRGPALAIVEGAEYQTIEKQIQPGDAVVMYTDGLYEVEGRDGEEFGEARLLAAAGQHAGQPFPSLFSALINEACLFAEDRELNDDVCLVGLRYKHPIP
jgi:sigma-B regulation protein RsbU (phosphoserine phosphatase)